MRTQTNNLGDNSKKLNNFSISSANYLLIKDGFVVGSFNSFYDACQYGFQEYKSSDFLVEKKLQIKSYK